MQGFWYCILAGGGNADEFPLIDAQLRKRNVKAEYKTLGPRARVYRIPDTETSKLPKDALSRWRGLVQEKGPSPRFYLPVTSDSGHSLYRLPAQKRDRYTNGIACWKRV